MSSTLLLQQTEWWTGYTRKNGNREANKQKKTVIEWLSRQNIGRTVRLWETGPRRHIALSWQDKNSWNNSWRDESLIQQGVSGTLGIKNSKPSLVEKTDGRITTGESIQVEMNNQTLKYGGF